jgi:hypothetical protein
MLDCNFHDRVMSGSIGKLPFNLWFVVVTTHYNYSPSRFILLCALHYKLICHPRLADVYTC